MRRLAIWITVTAVCLAALAGVAAARAHHWAHLTAVTVTIQNPSLPPPGDKAHAKHFKTARQLRRVTRALNRDRIARRANHTSGGCVGGLNVTIKITPHRGGRIRLTGYYCGGRTSGHIAGSVPAFLRAIGFKSL